jgi:hypothetical protein
MQDEPRSECMSIPPALLEREKWNKDNEFRNRELLVKERKLELELKEFEFKEREHASSTWRSPLVVAIFAAAVAAMGNAIVAYTNGNLQLQLEEDKAEQARILEMIKTGNPDSAAANLRFLLQSGLISNPSTTNKLEKFLRQRQAGSGPALPPTVTWSDFMQSLSEPAKGGRR